MSTLYFLADGTPTLRPPRGQANYTSCADWRTLADAQLVAAKASTATGRPWLGVDQGTRAEHRYDVIPQPRVGDAVGRRIDAAGRGVTVDEGTITSVNGTLRVITTSTGKKFYRLRESGFWYYARTDALVLDVTAYMEAR
mgnify:FL=1